MTSRLILLLLITVTGSVAISDDRVIPAGSAMAKVAMFSVDDTWAALRLKVVP